MPSFPKYRRDQLAEAKRGNAHYHTLYGDGKPPQVVYAPEKPKRERHAPDPNAPPLERDVLKAVWKYLNHHPKVAWVTRIQSGAAMMDFGADGVHPMHFNRKRGMSDLLGQLRDGRILCCECKREGAALMDHQREFLNEVLRNGGVAFVARCIEDAEKALREIR
jgi:hypothetical protein